MKRGLFSKSCYTIRTATLLAAFALWSAGSIAQTNTVPQRIGIYDSRAIAVAFAGSPVQEQWMQSITAEYNRAKATGDTNRVKQIDAEMRARQREAHKQAFTAASVEDLLKHIEGGVERVKQKTGVTVIISKWDTGTLKKHSSAEKVDVTMLLVDEFHPTERQRKSAIEIQKRPPITLQEANEIKK